jgi:hypothetical protein
MIKDGRAGTQPMKPPALPSPAGNPLTSLPEPVPGIIHRVGTNAVFAAQEILLRYDPQRTYPPGLPARRKTLPGLGHGTRRGRGGENCPLACRAILRGSGANHQHRHPQSASLGLAALLRLPGQAPRHRSIQPSPCAASATASWRAKRRRSPSTRRASSSAPRTRLTWWTCAIRAILAILVYTVSRAGAVSSQMRRLL